MTVEALNKSGLIRSVTTSLYQSAAHSVTGTAWSSGFIAAFASNLMNNLPVGLIAANAAQAARKPAIVKSAILIGVDLGPNLSITGSLANILWL